MNRPANLIVASAFAFFVLSFARADTLPPLACGERDDYGLSFQVPNSPTDSPLEISAQTTAIDVAWHSTLDGAAGHGTASAVLIHTSSKEAQTVFSFEREDTQEPFVFVLSPLAPGRLLDRNALSGYGQLLSLKTGKVSKIFCMDAIAARQN